MFVSCKPKLWALWSVYKLHPIFKFTVPILAVQTNLSVVVTLSPKVIGMRGETLPAGCADNEYLQHRNLKNVTDDETNV